jgi:toxin ParE1/3/4
VSQVFKTARAERDLEDIWFYIAENNPAAADQLLDNLFAQAQLVAT